MQGVCVYAGSVCVCRECVCMQGVCVYAGSVTCVIAGYNTTVAWCNHVVFTSIYVRIPHGKFIVYSCELMCVYEGSVIGAIARPNRTVA